MHTTIPLGQPVVWLQLTWGLVLFIPQLFVHVLDGKTTKTVENVLLRKCTRVVYINAK